MGSCIMVLHQDSKHFYKPQVLDEGHEVGNCRDEENFCGCIVLLKGLRKHSAEFGLLAISRVMNSK